MARPLRRNVDLPMIAGGHGAACRLAPLTPQHGIKPDQRSVGPWLKREERVIFSSWSADTRAVVRLKSCRLWRGDKAWDYGRENAGEIAAHWQRKSAANPRMFNGSILVLAGATLTDGHFEGELLATDFATFLHWKEHGYPDTRVRDVFGSSLLVSADGRVLLGRQSPGQLNSGLVYLPGGFIDARDVAEDGSVALAASTARELSEETGLSSADVTPARELVLTLSGALASIAVVYRTALTGEALADRVRAHIANDADPELDDVVLAGSRADLDAIAMPPYAAALLAALFPPPGDRLRLDLLTQHLEGAGE